MSPAVRLLLEKYHLHPRLIQATGPKGRLLKGDVLRYVAQGGKPFTKPEEEGTPAEKVSTKPAPSQQAKPAPEIPVPGMSVVTSRNAAECLVIIVCKILTVRRSWGSGGGGEGGVEVHHLACFTLYL